MAWQWNPWALPGLTVGALAVALALLVYRARPSLTQNKALAVLLFTGGLFDFAGLGLRFLTTEARSSYALWFAGILLLPVMAFSLFVLYGTFPGRVAAFARRRRLRATMGAATAAFAVIAVVRPDLLGGAMHLEATLSIWYATGLGWLWYAGVASLGVTGVLGVAVAVSGQRAATLASERAKVRWLAVAIGGFGAIYAAAILYLFVRATTVGSTDLALFDVVVSFYVQALAAAWLIFLLAYGILKTQLLDIDLKLKWTIKQGTVTAIVLATAFVVSELAALAFSEQVGPVMGILAAGVLVFAIAPLQRLAERVSDKAMPDVQDTPAYREARARELYEAALATACSDGAIDDRERDMLVALQEQLQIPPTEALALERAAMKSVGGRVT